MQLQESGEMYIETIHVLSQRLGAVRSLDVAEYMSFSKPSVSRAIGILKDNGYVLMGKEGYLTLTEKGLSVATDIYEKHQVISKVLMEIGVDEMHATEDACKIEHDISDVTFAAIKKYLKKMNKK